MTKKILMVAMLSANCVFGSYCFCADKAAFQGSCLFALSPGQKETKKTDDESIILNDIRNFASANGYWYYVEWVKLEPMLKSVINQVIIPNWLEKINRGLFASLPCLQSVTFEYSSKLNTIGVEWELQP